MPVTLSYDLKTDDVNKRTYIRSMFERFGWKRLGGSTLRYDGHSTGKGTKEEDWLNDVAPSLMFFRSYVLHHGIEVLFFTLDTNSVVHIDFSDPKYPYGNQPLRGRNLKLVKPTNTQSSVRQIRRFVTSAEDVIR